MKTLFQLSCKAPLPSPWQPRTSRKKGKKKKKRKKKQPLPQTYRHATKNESCVREDHMQKNISFLNVLYISEGMEGKHVKAAMGTSDTENLGLWF